MTITELKQSEEFRTRIDIIRSYSRGTVFTVSFCEMDSLKSELMHLVLKEASDLRLIDCISFDFNRDGVITEEMWRRI